MATVSQVKQGALEELKVVQIGQSAESQHDTRIGRAYTEVYNDLKTEGLATWAEAGTIPDEVRPHLEAMMAFNSINSFGVSDSLYRRISVKVGPDGETAKRAIRKLITPDYESLEEPVDY